MSNRAEPVTEGVALVGIEQGVMTITLNRPEAKNSLSPDLVAGIHRAMEAGIDDDSIRVIVLTNTGNTFCAGADLKATQPGVSGDDSGPTFIDVLNLMLDSPTPVIGRIAGHCTGGGVGLASACDISVMDADSLLGFTEVRIGVAPAVISVVCLPKLRPADANELFLTGERIPAGRAAEVGLVNYAVPADELDAKVDEIVGKVVRGGPNALAGTKQLLSRVGQADRQTDFEWTGVLSKSLFQSDEAREGIGAFRQRRDAGWIPGG
ncbi:MAG: enoyl-CoA hydratase [Actinomycetia bacterium]|nr:enoyl-CoA hydratase [Actinomycetes bacterium]MCP3911463.1 enoyl-CoA hydratase [Actinomycetes bacterium]MCP4084762.1 enoyl-CoA hydratase [Actinomycetes bacterium]